MLIVVGYKLQEYGDNAIPFHALGGGMSVGHFFRFPFRRFLRAFTARSGQPDSGRFRESARLNCPSQSFPSIFRESGSGPRRLPVIQAAILFA